MLFAHEMATLGGVSFDPLSILGCVQALDCEHVVLSGSNITQMVDYSGSGRHRAPHTGTIPIVPNWRGGRAAWSATVNGMVDLSAYAISQPYTMVVVGQWGPSAVNRPFLHQNTGSGSALLYQSGSSSAGGVWYFNGTESRVANPTTDYVNRPFIALITVGADGHETIWLDGTRSRIASTGGLATPQLLNSMWGLSWDGSSARWGAPLAAQFVYNRALTSAERAYLLSGLAARYNINTTGTQPYAVEINNSTSVASMGDYTAYNYNTPFSWSGWFKCTAASGAPNNVIVGKRQAGGTVAGWACEYRSDRWCFGMQAASGANNNVIEVMGAPPVGVWTHWAMTYNGSGTAGMKIYLDGTLRTHVVASNTLGSTSILSTTPLCVGADDYLRRSQGIHLNIANFAHELSGSDVAALYAAGRRGDIAAFPNLTNYWRFDQADLVTSVPNVMSGSGAAVPGGTRLQYIED